MLLPHADTLTWSRPRVHGHIPGARDGHSACTMGRQMYVFGGYEEQADRFSQDVHVLDLDTMHWQYAPTWVRSPSFLQGHLYRSHYRVSANLKILELLGNFTTPAKVGGWSRN